MSKNLSPTGQMTRYLFFVLLGFLALTFFISLVALSKESPREKELTEFCRSNGYDTGVLQGGLGPFFCERTENSTIYRKEIRSINLSEPDPLKAYKFVEYER